MMNQAIDLYECRFLKARSGQKDFPAGAGRTICAGLDIVDRKGQIAYYDWTQQEFRVLDCILPWETWKLETLQDGQLLEDCLKGLVYYFAEQKLGILDTIVLVVPYSFSAYQRSMIVKLAKNAGIQRVGLDSFGIFSSMAKHFGEKNQNAKTYDLICAFREHSFEISLIEVADGVYESWGTVALTSEGGWSSLSADFFEKRISSEINQFFRDLGFARSENGSLKNPNPSQREFRFFMCIQSNSYIEKVLTELTGKTAEKTYGTPAFGAMLQGQIWYGSSFARDILRLSTWNKNLWVGLGENGEKAMVIDRYRTIPTRKTVSLLLSTETRLRIYEGNYFNPAYDQQLLEVNLDGLAVEEGKEIACELDIDALGTIRVSVTNHKKECILNHYEI